MKRPRKCFVCGVHGWCEHREPELVSTELERVIPQDLHSSTPLSEAYRSHQDEVKAARAQVAAALKTGALQRPLRCDECDNYAIVQGHHEDYSRPLELQWLCRRCHVLADWKRRNSGKLPVNLGGSVVSNLSEILFPTKRTNGFHADINSSEVSNRNK